MYTYNIQYDYYKFIADNGCNLNVLRPYNIIMFDII